MIEISTQIIDGRSRGLPARTFVPFSDEDLEPAMSYNVNQIVRAKIKGTLMERSLPQLRQYWGVCGVASENSRGNIQLSTKEGVDFHCRVSTRFVLDDLTYVHPNGGVTLNYGSISFPNLKHILACKYFTNAYAEIERFSGTSIEEFKAEFMRRKFSNY